MNVTVGFAGLTHLGIVYSAAVADKSFSVIGYDPETELINKINAGVIPVSEPGLTELMCRNNGSQKFTSDINELEKCDVVYVSSDVPTDDTGKSDLGNIDHLIKELISVVSQNCLLVILCQAPPGYTRCVNFDEHRLFYQVETLIFGDAVERALKPERIIVGSAKPDKELPSSFRAILDSFACPVLNMRYESAELTKIAINMCLVSSITVANTMAEICEKIGADWYEVLPALKLDRRIGKYSYLTPGLGLAGGNLERDISTLTSLSVEHGTEAGILRAFTANSIHRRQWALSVLQTLIQDAAADCLLTVWGLAYKENTNSIKNSSSIHTIMQLKDVRINLHDPIIEQVGFYYPHQSVFKNPLDAVINADILAILTPWPEYASIDFALISERMRGNVIIDPYRIFDPIKANSFGFHVYALGLPPLT